MILTCFKAYDIRGKLCEELNEDVVYRIGRAYAQHLGAKRVVVGGDIRLTSESLKQTLVNGLMDGSADVIDNGMTGTEGLYFAAFHLDVDGSIEVTASHNPMDYNGMKLVVRGAVPISGDTGLKAIQALAEANLFPASTSRGTFPNGISNPLLPENRAATADAVKLHGADMGIAWDGDLDRCFLFDEHGEFIEGYYIVGLLAKAFLDKNPGEKIIHDPRLTWNTIDMAKRAGGVPIQSKTGHTFLKERMRAENAIYGSEMSAHHYFRDFAYCDSGMIPWLLVAELHSRHQHLRELAHYCR